MNNWEKTRISNIILKKGQNRKVEGKRKTKVGMKLARTEIRSIFKLVAFFNFAVFLILRKNCGKICEVLTFTARLAEF